MVDQGHATAPEKTGGFLLKDTRAEASGPETQSTCESGSFGPEVAIKWKPNKSMVR